MMKLNHKITNKGITLIALIITIIILLILAGVALASLSGENGLLKRANEAKKESEKESIKEQIQLEVFGSYGSDGDLELNKLKENIEKNIPESQVTGKEFPITVVEKGYIYTIDENGNVEYYKNSESIAEEIIKNPKEYYGKKVTNYKANDDDTNTYRIFYVDEENYFGDGKNTIYLKADNTTLTYNLNSYASYDTANTKVKVMNPKWAKARGNEENKWNINEKAAAYLCSPVNATNKEQTKTLPWNSYYDEDTANYVIGGPSAEMYVQSYNQAYENEEGIYVLGASYRPTDYPGYIYTLNGERSTISNSDCYTGTNSLDCNKYNDMYSEKGGVKAYWWLTSPSADLPSDVCTVRWSEAYLGNDRYYDKCAICPIVCLKSSFLPKIEK